MNPTITILTKQRCKQ